MVELIFLLDDVCKQGYNMHLILFADRRKRQSEVFIRTMKPHLKSIHNDPAMPTQFSF